MSCKYNPYFIVDYPIADYPRFFFMMCIYNSQLHLVNPPDQEVMWMAA